jgi:1A family penicillin-binding protein
MKIIKLTVFLIYSLVFVSFISLIIIYFNIKNDLPRLPSSLINANLQLPVEIYSSNGKLIKSFGNRMIVKLDNISPFFIRAILAAEDSRFYDHKGIDVYSILRSIIKNLKNRRIVQGGSTITQQLSKNLFFSFKKNWNRKFKEILIALQIEAMFSKQEILEAYCNQIYFGQGNYGVEEASNFYFGKESKNLKINEAAMLAGIVSMPEKANPVSNFVLAQKKKNAVLKRMEKVGLISYRQRITAERNIVNLKKHNNSNSINQYFIDYVLNKLKKKYGPEFVYFGGIKVFTTINTNYQKIANNKVNLHLKFLDKNISEQNGKKIQIALVSLDNQDGAIRVMIGGRNYKNSNFNRAISNKRLPGSAFKPFIYMSAMENLGFNPGTVVLDEPVSIYIKGSGLWKPKNYNEKYFGPITLKYALAKSLNSVAAKLVFLLKPKTVIETARKFGIKSPLGNNLSLALGSSGVSPLEIASAYSVIANSGNYYQPYAIKRVEDFTGNTIFKYLPLAERRFSETSIYPLLDMMKGVMDNGSGRVVRKIGFKNPAGGKTGTTNNSNDGWFVGFNKEYSTAIWGGYDHNKIMLGPNGKGLTGSQIAGPIWASFYKKIMKGKTSNDFNIPRGIKFVRVNRYSGLLDDKENPDTFKVAINQDIVLPGLSNKKKKGSKLFQQKYQDGNREESETVLNVVSSNESKESLESKVWFLLNLDTASLGNIDVIPTSWLLKLLLDTKNIGLKVPGLKEGRDKVISIIKNREKIIDSDYLNLKLIKNSLTSDEFKKQLKLN